MSPAARGDGAGTTVDPRRNPHALPALVAEVAARSGWREAAAVIHEFEAARGLFDAGRLGHDAVRDRAAAQAAVALASAMAVLAGLRGRAAMVGADDVAESVTRAGCGLRPDRHAAEECLDEQDQGGNERRGSRRSFARRRHGVSRSGRE